MTSSPCSAAEPAAEPAADPAAAAAAAGPNPVVWSRRLRRFAFGLLLLGALGLVAAASALVVMSGGRENGDYAAPSDQFSPVLGAAEVTVQDETVLGLFFNASGTRGAPDGTCQVTGPHGERLQKYVGSIQNPAIDGTPYLGQLSFVTTGPGVYTVTCTDTGYLAGPAYQANEPSPGSSRDLVAAVLLVVTAALLLSAVPAVPLLLASLTIRLVQGHREETPARQRVERWLTLVVACLVGGLLLGGLDAITVAAGVLDPERAAGDHEPFMAALGTLPVLLLLLIVVVIGVLRWRRARSTAGNTLDLTVP